MNTRLRYYLLQLLLLFVVSMLATVNATAAPTLIYSDDFTDGVIDGFWLPYGQNVIESDGLLKIQENVTDTYASVIHKFDQSILNWRIEMRHYMHSSNNFFFPGVGFSETSGTKSFNFTWRRSEYAPDYCNISANYNKVMVRAAPATCYPSDLVSSDYYDKWITSFISYDAATGKVDYDLGGDGTIDFSVTLSAAERPTGPVTLSISGYGWWTGHYHNIDWIKIYTQTFTTDNGNGTVTDNVTGLVWQRTDDGASRVWPDAINYCETLSLGGKTDWRLPNVKELKSIVDYTKYSPAIDTAAFPDTQLSFYWSSASNTINSSYAWSVDFSDGNVGNGSKSYDYYVRCVRGGQ